ncbi:methylated-DNA--[protein]-cysteine S-methyltransferase [Agrobacterium sp. rho-13.3]|uniref:methylated-DNA--[protein]-cysteine S-methyltransferase n=1 Tax=Agrobacterium sp. rho-13.3 TaxID=3072980 RepID=UPI002A0EA0BA|nr:methylated-DNA--[protein]-cysteine S-methyltransferase [Agrobacterium sp. rho-13.3]MDX8311847.1 methylated-DNA--[protein]-cysteine S-methyltransferase [Agrobacterium sp. rho-13.3]
MHHPLQSHVFSTAAGYCAIAWHEGGIMRFQLPTKTADEAARLMLRKVPAAKPTEATADIRDLIDRVKAYFAGERVEFLGVALDLGEQSDFFSKVYASVRSLPWGHATTYGALAKELGAGPEAARDVGQAMAKNPVPLIIPCHRVLAAGGKLGGFSAPGGVTAKVHMLELEGIVSKAQDEAQASLF